MNTTTRLKAPLALAGALALTLAGATLSSAHAQGAQPSTSVNATGDRTTHAGSAASKASGEISVKLSRRTTARLAQIHAMVRTTGAASQTTRHGVTTLRFPVKTYNHDGTPVALRGGVTFRRGAADLHLDHFRLPPRQGRVMATIERDARASFLRLSTDRHGVVHAQLNKLMAGQLNTTFDTHRFAAGQTFGTLHSNHLPGSGASTETITVHIKNSTKWTLIFHDADTDGQGHVTQKPADVLLPGESTEIDVASGGSTYPGAQVTVYYRVVGAIPDWTIHAYFQVPVSTTNTGTCIKTSQVTWNACGIGTGSNPQGNWEPAMTLTSPVFDFGDSGSVWTFRKAEATDRGLAVDGASHDDTAQVSLWQLNNTRNERWTWVPSTDHPGFGQLVNLESGKCLEHNESNGNIDQWPCADSDNHLWKPVYDKTDNSTALLLRETDNGQPQYLGMDTDPSSAGQGAAIVLDNTLSNRTSWYPNPNN